ncbi:hypothetical protein B1756_09535 [Natrarchaeobaculum aegyptiacum]|uniref:Uncharacterized protein n=1 Tax=Natrarchaeobaculum aegyptiacum TaxID=745377 RepID=A0A2Z2HRX8_9EURY|nr:hypothetical protein B1756_09535 [Natrarchaeobaculum aegyptiacum]
MGGLTLAGYLGVSWLGDSEVSETSSDDGSEGYGNETASAGQPAAIESGGDSGGDDAGAIDEQSSASSGGSGGGSSGAAVNPSTSDDGEADESAVSNDGDDTAEPDDEITETTRGYGRDPYGHPA